MAFCDILPTEGQMKKTCFKCSIEKDINDFYVHPQMADGHLGKCKECCKMDEKIRRLDHPERIAAYEKTRGRIKYSATMTRLWRLKHPEKYKAQNKLNNALRDGKILKPNTCEICGSNSHIHAHHEYYSQPLLVVWICAKCHGQIQ